MFIVCKTCANSYHIPDEILGDEPRQFRCSGCGRSWELRPRADARRFAPPRRAASRRAPDSRAGAAPRAGAASGAPGAQARRAARRRGLLAGSMTAIGARESIVAAAPLDGGRLCGDRPSGQPARASRSRRCAPSSAKAADKNSRGRRRGRRTCATAETAAPDLRIALRARRRARTLRLDGARAEETGWRAGSACASPPGSPRRPRGSWTRW